MCNCKCDCCNPSSKRGYSEHAIRLAEQLRDKAVRNLEKTPRGQEILARMRKETKL